MVYNFRKWAMKNLYNSEEDMKFVNKKFNLNVCHVYADGKGENTQVYVRYFGYESTNLEYFTIPEAKDFMKCLEEAIIDAERREKMVEKEEEE